MNAWVCEEIETKVWLELTEKTVMPFFETETRTLKILS